MVDSPHGLVGRQIFRSEPPGELRLQNTLPQPPLESDDALAIISIGRPFRNPCKFLLSTGVRFQVARGAGRSPLELRVGASVVPFTNVLGQRHEVPLGELLAKRLGQVAALPPDIKVTAEPLHKVLH